MIYIHLDTGEVMTGPIVALATDNLPDHDAQDLLEALQNDAPEDVIEYGLRYGKEV